MRVGGAVALGSQPFEIPYSLGSEFDVKAMALVGEEVFEFGGKLIEIRPGYFEPEISVFKRGVDGGKPERVDVFRVKVDTLQYRLGAAFPVSATMIALQAGSEHPHVNSLTLFDVTTNLPVGYVPYSELLFLPFQNALRIASPLTRATDNPAALEQVRRSIRIVPILKNGKLNRDLAESDLFGR